MKKLSVLFAAVAMFVTTGVVSAQKFATMDVNAVLEAMPEKKTADEKIDAFRKAKETEMEKVQLAFQKELEQYKTVDGPKMTAEQRQKKEEELQKRGTELQKQAVTAQQDLYKKSDETYAPIEKKFNDAVAKVAKANGWDYVMDVNSSAFVYRNGPDATGAVKAELGIK